MSCALMRQSQSLITNFYRGMTFTNGNGNVIGVISIRTLYYPGHIKMDIMNKISFVTVSTSIVIGSVLLDIT